MALIFRSAFPFFFAFFFWPRAIVVSVGVIAKLVDGVSGGETSQLNVEVEPPFPPFVRGMGGLQRKVETAMVCGRNGATDAKEGMASMARAAANMDVGRCILE